MLDRNVVIFFFICLSVYFVKMVGFLVYLRVVFGMVGFKYRGG